MYKTAKERGMYKKAESGRQSGIGMTGERNRRSLRSSSNNKRPSFNSEIRSAIPVGKGQARCHLISWKDIHDNVYEICGYTCMYEDMGKWFSENMRRLWYAVTGEENLSNKYEASLGDFLGAKDKTIPKIVDILNNQRGNLRLGASGTNSSIGSALDLPATATGCATLLKGAVYTKVWREPDGLFKKCRILNENMRVILITDKALIKRLMAFLDIQTSVEPSVYTTGDTVQSSDNPDQSCGEDLEEGDPIGFQVEDSSLYYLFTPDNNKHLF